LDQWFVPSLWSKYQVYLTTPGVEIHLRTPSVVHLSHIQLGHRRSDTISPTIEVSTACTPLITVRVSRRRA